MLACKGIFTTTTKYAFRASGATRYACSARLCRARHKFSFFGFESDKSKKLILPTPDRIRLHKLFLPNLQNLTRRIFVNMERAHSIHSARAHSNCTNKIRNFERTKLCRS